MLKGVGSLLGSLLYVIDMVNMRYYKIKQIAHI
jgi:hypothetical protein